MRDLRSALGRQRFGAGRGPWLCLGPRTQGAGCNWGCSTPPGFGCFFSRIFGEAETPPGKWGQEHRSFWDLVVAG